MAYTILTQQFRELVAKSTLPDAKQRKRKHGVADPERRKDALLNKEYLLEAYNILNHVTNLTRMLSAIRRPYLNLDSEGATFGRQIPRSFDPNSKEQSWSEIRRLTDEERDQIDLQTRIIISKCAERVRQLELLENKRAELAAKDASPLVRWLPLRLKSDASSMVSASIAAHHTAITYFLNSRLAKASTIQKEMQEERIRRQMDRTRSLGSGAAREAVASGLHDGTHMQTKGAGSSATGWFGDASSSFATTVAATMGLSTSNSTSSFISGSQPAPINPRFDEDEDEEYDDLELSSSQIQQFETENANILRSVQDTLASVQQAESRLLDISALQMELIAHLTRQTELTDQLYEDAVETTATMEKGNVQLKEAKRRAKDSRLYILVFLLGASFALLFLHYY